VLNAVESPAKIDGVLEDLDALVKGNDHFEFFWMPHTDMALTKKNNRSTEPPRPLSRFRHWYQRSFLENTAFGTVCAVGRIRPRLIPALAQVVAASGRLDYSDESFRIFASPRRVRFVEMEYSIPVEACASALDDVRSMIDRRKFLVNFPVEVRFTAADDAVLSTAHGRDSAYIAVHMYRGMDYEPYFRAVEEIMLSHGGRPHWGKMHFLTERELSGMYPEWANFQAARQHLDPDGTFENAYVRRVFGSNR
jgi:FAD/FMN-containing dehydrogenase